MRCFAVLMMMAACNGDGQIAVDKDGTDDGSDTDGGGQTGPNTAPTAPTVSIAPAAPGGGDDLVANLVFEAEDADGDTLTYHYAWVVDGAPRADQTASIVPAAATLRGEVWQVFVRADDGRDEGPPGTASVSIGNGAPTLAPIWQVPYPSGDDVLTIDANAIDPDGDPLTVTYTWYVDGALVGYTGPTVPPEATAIGQTWRVAITAADNQGGSAYAESSVTIQNRLPVLSGLVVTPSPAHVKDPLVAAYSASDPDNDPFTTTYAWTMNGAPTAFTGAVIPVGATHDGETWTVTVTLDDHRGTLVSGTASTTVINHAPVLSSLTLRPAVPGDSENLVADLVSSDADGDPLTNTLTWFRNGVVFRTGPGLQVLAFNTAPGDTWYVTASVTDGDKTSSTLTSNSVTVIDLPPTTPVVQLNPEVPSGCGPLVCSTLGTPTDPDGQSVALTYTWTKNGSPFTATTTTTVAGDTVPEVALTSGATFTCRVTATAGSLSSSGTASATVPANGLLTETFTASARSQVDVLLMVDDSIGAVPVQTQVLADIGALTDELARASLDWHLGVVTTDMTLDTRTGRLTKDATSGLRWVTPTTPNGPAVVAALADVGSGGDGAYEQGIAATLAAYDPLDELYDANDPTSTTPSDVASWNAGFFRPAATLALLYVSDEDDQGASDGRYRYHADGTAYAAALRAAKPVGDIVVQGLVGPTNGCSDSGRGIYAVEGSNYLQLVSTFDGGWSSICDASYRPAFETFAGRVTGLQRHLTLAAPAPTGVASVVQITPGGSRSTLTQGSAWSYDATANQVVITATPASGTRFEVTYAPGCPSDGPADTGVVF